MLTHDEARAIQKTLRAQGIEASIQEDTAPPRYGGLPNGWQVFLKLHNCVFCLDLIGRNFNPDWSECEED